MSTATQPYGGPYRPQAPVVAERAPVKYTPCIERVIGPATTSLHQLDHGAGVRVGLTLELDGVSCGVPLPSLGHLKTERLETVEPVAVYCPHCAAAAGYSAESPARCKVHRCMVRYGRLGFFHVKRGKDRFEWFTISNSLICSGGHFLRLHTENGATVVRAWPFTP